MRADSEILDPLQNVDIKVVGSRRTLGIATKSANARNTRFKSVARNESWICDELSGVRINWRVVSVGIDVAGYPAEVWVRTTIGKSS